MEEARFELVTNHEFYANLLYQTEMNWDEKVQVAGVSIKNGRIQLYINPTVWKQLNAKQKAGILLHEMGHVIGQHMIRGEYLKIAHIHMNYAADLAINQNNNPYLPLMKFPRSFFEPGAEGETGPLLVSEINKQNGLNMELGREMEYYAKALEDGGVVQYVNGDGKGDGSFDDHSKWEESDADEATQKAIVAGALEEAAKCTTPGKVPGDIAAKVLQLRKPQYCWKRVLAHFIARAQSRFTKTTRSRRNRRFGILQPGNRTETRMHVVCCVDTSGSVCDQSLNVFSPELVNMVCKNIKVTIIEADYAVQRVYELTHKGIQEFKGRGGTSFVPAIDAAVELDPDAIIYFTDGEGEAPKKCKYPFLWVLNNSNKAPASYGKTLRVKV